MSCLIAKALLGASVFPGVPGLYIIIALNLVTRPKPAFDFTNRMADWRSETVCGISPERARATRQAHCHCTIPTFCPAGAAC